MQAHGVPFLFAGTVSPAQCWPQPLAGAALPSWFWAQKPWGSSQLLLLGCHSDPGTSVWCKMWLLIFVMTCPAASTAFYVCWNLQRWNWREPSCEWVFPFPSAFLNPLFIYFFLVSFFSENKKKQNSDKISPSFTSFLCTTKCAKYFCSATSRFYFSSCFINMGWFLFICFKLMFISVLKVFLGEFSFTLNTAGMFK